MIEVAPHNGDSDNSGDEPHGDGVIEGDDAHEPMLR
jgi:hypothetical protein